MSFTTDARASQALDLLEGMFDGSADTSQVRTVWSILEVDGGVDALSRQCLLSSLDVIFGVDEEEVLLTGVVGLTGLQSKDMRQRPTASRDDHWSEREHCEGPAEFRTGQSTTPTLSRVFCVRRGWGHCDHRRRMLSRESSRLARRCHSNSHVDEATPTIGDAHAATHRVPATASNAVGRFHHNSRTPSECTSDDSQPPHLPCDSCVGNYDTTDS